MSVGSFIVMLIRVAVGSWAVMRWTEKLYAGLAMGALMFTIESLKS